MTTADFLKEKETNNLWGILYDQEADLNKIRETYKLLATRVICIKNENAQSFCALYSPSCQPEEGIFLNNRCPEFTLKRITSKFFADWVVEKEDKSIKIASVRKLPTAAK